MQFAWFNSAGDFDYFSAWLPLLVMSRMLQPTASDYWAFVKTSAHRQAVITSELEKASQGSRGHFPSALLRRGLGRHGARNDAERPLLLFIYVYLCPVCVIQSLFQRG